jgi:hypothetical protein
MTVLGGSGTVYLAVLADALLFALFYNLVAPRIVQLIGVQETAMI